MQELNILRGTETIHGRIFIPDGEGRFPAIIISHGYNGSHMDFEYHCNYFMERGYLVFAYDFCGGSTRSMSTGETTHMTISSEIADLMAVFDMISNHEKVDASRILLFGESQGGLVTTMVAEQVKERAKAMCLFYPALCIPHDWAQKYPDLSTVPEHFDFWGMELGRGFIEDIRQYDVFEQIGGFEGPVLIIHGDKDPVVDCSYSQRAIQKYKNAKVHIIEGQGHGFDEGAREIALELICQFVQKEFEVEND